jgi:energy-coupling factor transporter ATP-binding protein EcfA2
MSPVKHSSSWLSDDPLEGRSATGEDSYNRRPYVEAVLKVLFRTREQSESSVLALVGAWGSGKSTVLNMLQVALEKQAKHDGSQKWLVATFNPWVYSDLLSLQSGFFSELRAALPRENRWKDARRHVRNWGKVVTPLASAAGLWGVDGGAVAGGLVENFAAFSPTATQRSAEKALRKHKQPILMILDDLDRLTADELMHVFKFVRLVGRLPYVYYLLGYDEETLVDLINTTDLVPRDSNQRALDYLEKIVQVRLDLPALLDQQVQDDFYESVDELVAQHGILIDQGDLNRIRRAFDEVLAARLRTPRSLSRFFGQVDAFLPVVSADVDFVDFLLITWIRVNYPAVYSLVQERHNEILGGGGITLRNLTREEPQIRRERWVALLTKAGVPSDDLDDVFFLLAQLFPAVKRIRDAEKMQINIPEPKPLRIAHFDYFDRFFSFGVPVDDLPDSVVEDALHEIVDEKRGDAFERMQIAFDVAPSRILRKVSDKMSGGKFVGRLVIRWLAEVYDRAPEWQPGFLSTRDQISGLTGAVFSRMTPKDIAISIADVSVSEPGLQLATRAVSMLRGKETGGMDEIKQWNALGNGANAQFEKLYRDLFDRYQGVQPLYIPDSAWYRIWDWQELNPVAAKDFVATQIAEGRWSPLEMLARVTQISIASSEAAVGSIMGFDVATAERLVDLGEVRRLLEKEIEKSEPLDANWRHQPATPENLRRFVLSYLRSAVSP